jgi:hypothetical protein
MFLDARNGKLSLVGNATDGDRRAHKRRKSIDLGTGTLNRPLRWEIR